MQGHQFHFYYARIYPDNRVNSAHAHAHSALSSKKRRCLGTIARLGKSSSDVLTQVNADAHKHTILIWYDTPVLPKHS